MWLVSNSLTTSEATGINWTKNVAKNDAYPSSVTFLRACSSNRCKALSGSNFIDAFSGMRFLNLDRKSTRLLALGSFFSNHASEEDNWFFCSDKKSICISLKIDAPATGSPGGSTDMSMSEVSRVQGCHYDIANKTNYLLGSTPTSGRFGTF